MDSELKRSIILDNYENPINQYMHSISENLDINSVPVNNINLMPYLIEINKGIERQKTALKEGTNNTMIFMGYLINFRKFIENFQLFISNEL